MKGRLLFNPTSLVHERSLGVFRERLPEWGMNVLYNPRQLWFRRKLKERHDNEYCFSAGYFQRAPRAAFKHVKAVVLFTAQSRVPPASIIETAAGLRIPVIALEEVYMWASEQGYVDNYVLPVDHILAGSDFERVKFMEAGVSANGVETTGCMFRHKAACNDQAKKRALKEKLGLSRDKKVATLSLSFLFTEGGGETADVRRELLTLMAQGLPAGYELMVKPHPSETDPGLREMAGNICPGARIADGKMPMDDVLLISDAIFNRGNSKAVIDAIENRVPAAVIPAGRETFFDRELDVLIVREKEHVARALDAIEKNGMAIYKNVAEKYFPASAEESIARVMGRIAQIAESGEIFEPDKRMNELALFWAWMGYPGQAVGRKLPLDIKCLVTGKDHKRAAPRLVHEYRGTYICNIVKSLWVQEMFFRNIKMSPEERAHFSGFPPKTNRAAFIPYAAMLYSVYTASGYHDEAGKLLKALRPDFGFRREIRWLESGPGCFKFKAWLAAKQLYKVMAWA